MRPACAVRWHILICAFPGERRMWGWLWSECQPALFEEVRNSKEDILILTIVKFIRFGFFSFLFQVSHSDFRWLCWWWRWRWWPIPVHYFDVKVKRAPKFFQLQLMLCLIFVVPCIMLNSEIIPTRCNNCVYSSQWLYSTCFGRQFHSSSWVQCCIWPFR